MTTLQDMEAQLDTVRGQLQELAMKEEQTDDDVIVVDTLIREHDDLEAKAQPLRERMAKLTAIKAAGDKPENREEPRQTAEPPQGGIEFMKRHDPLAELDRVRMGMVPRNEMRARALNLIESDNANKRNAFLDDHAQESTLKVQETPSIAQHILLTGSEAYREAFRSYLEKPQEGEYAFRSGELEEEMRFRSVNLTNASGGFLLPYVLDPTIVLSNAASANPYRRVSRIVQTTSNAWQGVNSAGVNAGWIAETVTAADAAPTDLAQIKITPAKAACWVLGTYEALDDTDFGMQLPGLLSDAKDRLESAAFATGTGTNSPLGIVVGMGVSGRVAPTVTGTAFGGTGSIPDIGNLMATLAPRFRRSPACAFMANIVHINKIRSMDQYGGGGFWANLTSNTPPGLYGFPIYESSDLPAVTTGASGATGTASDTLFMGDWNQYVICDRVGVSMLYDPLIKGSGNAQLPAGMAGWFMFWRVGTAVATTAGFVHLTVS
jgi:HK97 family phage major capsid protein